MATEMDELEFSGKTLGQLAAWFQGKLSHQKFQHKVREKYYLSFVECEALYQILERIRYLPIRDCGCKSND